MTRRTKVLLFGGLFVLVLGTWVFGSVANSVAEGETRDFDAGVLRALRRPDDPARGRGPAWMPGAMRDVTALGGFVVLALVVVGVTGYLTLSGRGRAALLVVAAVLGGLLLSALLKGLFGRPRPDVVPALTEVASSSFPSGHSMMSAVTYLTLGTLADHFEPNRRLRVFYFAGALLVTFLVGLSRVYLGVHYPTDVLAGWAAGLAWAGLCWLALAWLQNRS